MPGASTLVIETSTPQASLAMVTADGDVVQRGFASDRSHNALLFEPMQELLHGMGLQKISRVIVGSGPGSYSGTRVGIAAAQGVALAYSCPAVAVPSILAVPAADGGAACLAIGDARRGSYWTARVENHYLFDEPTLCEAAELASRVAQALADGMAVFAFEEVSRFPLDENHRSQIRLEFPDATRLWHAWNAADAETQARWSAAIPQPLYLKPPHITPGKRSAFQCLSRVSASADR